MIRIAISEAAFEATRRPGERYSDVILRLVEVEARGGSNSLTKTR